MAGATNGMIDVLTPLAAEALGRGAESLEIENGATAFRVELAPRKIHAP